MRKENRLGEKDRQFLSLRSLNLTEAQRSDRREYQPGAVVLFVQKAKGFKKGERVTVEGADQKASALIARTVVLFYCRWRRRNGFRCTRQGRLL